MNDYFVISYDISKIDKDMTSTHQTTIPKTIHSFIAIADISKTAKNLIPATPRTPVMYLPPKFTNLKTQVK